MENTQAQKNTLSLIIRDPEKLIFKGDVKTISSFNEKGPFDVLPQHENFISIIKDNIVVGLENGKKEFNFKEGIMRVSENTVKIFVGTEVF
jgi:F0F1-type ATP synthase epsilon subunit